MGIRRTEGFRSEAVRIVLTSGLSQKQVAADLSIGLSTLGKWITSHKHTELLSGPHNDKDKELARLRKENRTLREERDILKKSDGLLRESKSVRFRFIEKEKADFSIRGMCIVLRVSESGYYAWVRVDVSSSDADGL